MNAARGVGVISAAAVGLGALVAVGAIVAACTREASSVERGSLPCAVDEIFATRCRACHGASPAFGAPMPLVSLDEMRAPARSNAAKKVYELVGARVHDAKRPMPEPPSARLTAPELAAIDAWVRAGAPSGAACTSPPPTQSVPDAGLTCAPDTRVAPAAAFELPASGGDLFICYGFPTNRASKRHVVGFAPRIDNRALVHHATLLQADVAVSPVPAPCPQEAMASWRSVYGWAPGTGAFELPPEVGFPDEPGAHFVVQLHYVVAPRPPGQASGAARDASGFDLCTTETLRANDADLMAFGTHQITVPARGRRSLACSIPVPPTGATTHLFAAFPHMHKRGAAISSVARPGGVGAPVDLGTVTKWDLNRQSWMPIDYVLRPGDVVETRCDFENPSDFPVGFGPGAEDEMCYSFVMYYPKIRDPNWHWSLPAAYSVCQ